MDKQQEIYDTITIMKEYNFHKPINISVIIEDHDTEPNQLKVLDYGENNLMTTSLQENYHYVNYMKQQQYSSIRNKPINSSEIPSQRYSRDRNTTNLEYCQRYTSNNNKVNTSLHTENSQMYKELINPYNNSKAKLSFLYNSQKSETVLLSRVAEILASIMEAYVYYCTLISKSEDQQYITQLRAKCLRVKLNLFHKCLAVTKDLLLKHENNYRFIEKVLNKTEQISKVTLPKKHIAHLYGDLLKWIRFKKCETMKLYQNKKINEKFSAHTAHEASNFVSKSITYNTPATNIFSSGPPGSQVTISVDPKILEQQRIGQNVANSTTTDLPYEITNNTDTYNSPCSNYLFMGENNQQNNQSTLSNEPTWSSTMYDRENQLLQYALNNSCNTTFTEINQIDPQDISRSSISRDSGFTSPVISVSPSQYCNNNIQYSSAPYEQQTFNIGMPNVSTNEPNFAIEGPPFWSNV